ncbi:MAG: lysophospholipase [Candidatus Omnitrophica bacterium]|nr:lysophospholipase [Candidatus Omnitrophota bacterium]
MKMIRDKKTNVYYRKWNIPSPKAVLFLVHGLGAHCGRWEFLAKYFTKSKFAIYAIELQGFGETKGIKGHIDSFQEYYNHISSITAFIKKDHPTKKIFLLGESMGALISFIYTLHHPDIFAGLICLSPAFKNSIPFTFKDYLKVFTSYIYNPKNQLTMPFTPQMCTRDQHYQQVMMQDKREHQFASAKLLINILLAQIKAQANAKKLSTPTLFLLARKDYFVDPLMSLKIFNKIRMEDKTLIQYPEMHHSLSIDLNRDKVFGDILKWIENNY